MINIEIIISSVELGLIYSIMALGVFLSYRTLDMPDLTVDGSIVTGAATAAIICTNTNILVGNINLSPIIALVAAFIAGSIAGIMTGLLHTKLKIQPLLAGILVMLGLYSINFKIMGNKPNISLHNVNTIYAISSFEYMPLIIGAIMSTAIVVGLLFILNTRLGFVFRATGDNEDMVRASGYNSNFVKVFGLSLSNGLVGLAGGMLAQYQSFSDASMGTGMVVIGLASVIIGEVVFGTKTLRRRLIAVVLGAIVYRVIIAVALSLGMPANDLKLVSAVIVTLALSMGILAKKVGGKRA